MTELRVGEGAGRGASMGGCVALSLAQRHPQQRTPRSG
jgi:pimeloyl-ACP methyl ester carboxylesterase